MKKALIILIGILALAGLAACDKPTSTSNSTIHETTTEASIELPYLPK